MSKCVWACVRVSSKYSKIYGKIDTNKNTFPEGIYNGKCFIFFSEILRTNRTIYQRYHPGTFHFVCFAKLRRLFIIGCFLKHEALEQSFKTENLPFKNSIE